MRRGILTKRSLAWTLILARQQAVSPLFYKVILPANCEVSFHYFVFKVWCNSPSDKLYFKNVSIKGSKIMLNVRPRSSRWTPRKWCWFLPLRTPCSCIVFIPFQTCGKSSKALVLVECWNQALNILSSWDLKRFFGKWIVWGCFNGVQDQKWRSENWQTMGASLDFKK